MIHLKCKSKDLAKMCLLPGDPARTKFIAEKYLKNKKIISDFRGLLAYTGYYNGRRVSVVTTGMGCPSAGIVVEELIKLGAKVLIRVGTCGGVPKYVQPGNLIVPSSAIPLVGLLKVYNVKHAPQTPNSELLRTLTNCAEKTKYKYWVGAICTSDAFYREKAQAKVWENKNVLAFEMECAGVFMLARLRGIKAGAILTATGNILYGKQVIENAKISRAVDNMIKIALETAYGLKN